MMETAGISSLWVPMISIPLPSLPPDGGHLDTHRIGRLRLHAAIGVIFHRPLGKHLVMLAVIRQLPLGGE